MTIPKQKLKIRFSADHRDYLVRKIVDSIFTNERLDQINKDFFDFSYRIHRSMHEKVYAAADAALEAGLPRSALNYFHTFNILELKSVLEDKDAERIAGHYWFDRRESHLPELLPTHHDHTDRPRSPYIDLNDLKEEDAIKLRELAMAHTNFSTNRWQMEQQLSTLLSKCRTFGAALNKIPEFENFVADLLSEVDDNSNLPAVISCSDIIKEFSEKWGAPVFKVEEAKEEVA